MPNPVTIAGMTFASQLAAQKYAQAILNEGRYGSEVDLRHRDFLLDLLLARPEKREALKGRAIIRFIRDRQPNDISANVWTICFWAVLKDGRRLVFSYKDSIKALAAAQGEQRVQP